MLGPRRTAEVAARRGRLAAAVRCRRCPHLQPLPLHLRGADGACQFCMYAACCQSRGEVSLFLGETSAQVLRLESSRSSRYRTKHLCCKSSHVQEAFEVSDHYCCWGSCIVPTVKLRVAAARLTPGQRGAGVRPVRCV